MYLVYTLIAAVLITGSAVQYALVARSGAVPMEAPSEAQAKSDGSIFLTLEPGMDREAIVEKVGTAFGFDTETKSQLHDTYRAMQWDALNETLVPYLVEKHGLTEEDREILLTHSTAYLNKENDILESFYKEKGYTFTGNESIVETVTSLLAPVTREKEMLVDALIDPEAEAELLSYVRSENELLPDLVPLPPLDLAIKEEAGRTLLIFTTVYYNQGRGDLELRADPNTIGVIGDFERDVYQRIYHENGTYRERVAGTFEWHQEHLHYHFRDFITYELSAREGTAPIESGALAQKSTFCIRDVSKVYLPEVPQENPAKFQICGRERQGVTVGWGDAYFNTYVDQNLNITELPSGEYVLTFVANPADRFDEITKENNVSSVRFRYNKENKSVEVIEMSPSELPHFEHIHIEQNL